MLRIRNWDKHFETHKTKILKRINWVPMPNAHDDLGYVQIVNHDNGAAHLGVWLVLVQIASRASERGYLTQSGKDLGARDIAAISRLPEALIAEAIERLLHEVNWLEEVSSATHQAEEEGKRRVAPDCAGSRRILPFDPAVCAGSTPDRAPESGDRRKGIEGKGIEGNGREEEPRPAPDITPESPFTGPDISQIAAALVDEILPLHLGGGSRQYAISEAERALFDAVDPAKVADAIREAHRKYRAFWTTERERNPRYYIPRLDGWFQSRDYLTPPSAEVAAPKLAPYEEKRRRADALIEAAFAIRAAKGDRA